ncbi:MAG: phosphatidylglycerophosphatase A family protein [Candidatus Binatia bacterium]
MLGRRVIVFLASGAYLGYAPVASGTVGTLAGVAVFPVFAALQTLSVPIYVLSAIALSAAAIAIADLAEKIFEEEDSGKIVIDEVAGYIAATLFLPFDLTTIVVSFFLFRLFDVLKPWPAGWFDREVGGGAGVVLDDVFAGLYANLTFRLGAVALGVLC